MSKFNRGLDDAFVRALNREYDKGGWWRRIVDDRDLFVAIRKNSLNVYYRGASLIKLNRRREGIVGEIHYKYILKRHIPDSDIRKYIKRSYIKVIDGEFYIPSPIKDSFIDNLSVIQNKALDPYIKPEKEGVYSIIENNANIVDIEVGLVSSDKKVSYIDFTALHRHNEGVNIIF